MRIYPAIDIIDGKCVRLVQGKYDQQTTFNEDPVSVAKMWEAQGGAFIHIVDLDGAKSGDMPNFDLIAEIAASVSIPVEVGGGIRNMEAVRRYLEAGIQRVILGTSAITDRVFLQEAVHMYKDRIVVGIDAKDGHVAIHGWEQVSDITADALARDVARMGVRTIIYTDIATDGMLKGPNLSAMREMVAAVPGVDIVASGGVSNLSDIELLKETGVEGAIVGKALYTKNIDLQSAVEKGR